MYLAAGETVEFHIAEAQTNSAGNSMMNGNCCYMGIVQQKKTGHWSVAHVVRPWSYPAIANQLLILL